MDYRLLGSLEIDCAGRAVSVGAAKQRALLAILLLHPNQAVSVDRLVDLIWGESPPDRAENALQVYVSALRKLLEPDRAKGAPPAVLLTRSPGYELRVAAGERDVDRFAELSRRAQEALDRGEPEAAADDFRAALGLWRGPALADFAFETFARTAIAELDEARAAAVEGRVEAELALGRHAELIAELTSLVEEYPLRERLRGQLIIALYRAGRQGDALAAYREARRVLLEELGVDPTPALVDLETSILNQTASLAAPARTITAVPRAEIPAPPSRLLGRSRELGELVALVIDPAVRLVTITGPGGAGKTRLSLEVAAEAAGPFAQRVCFVPLAGVASANLVLPTVATALGIAPTEAALLAALVDHLSHHSWLLVLDNLEHVTDAAVDVAALLKRLPQLTVLVSSQSALRVAAEYEYPLAPLEVPDPASTDRDALLACPSVALFLERASSAGGCDPSGTDLAAVAQICRRLDGLPLALELAAARTNVLTPAAIVDRLATPLDLLTRGPRDADSRHAALRDALEWSHGLLGPDEQSLFAQLAVFRGGCSLDAVEAVAAGLREPTLDVVASLVDMSLLAREHLDGEPRFRMLEVVRQFAYERLLAAGGASDAGRAHAEWVRSLVAVGQPDADELRRRALVDRDLDNVRAALQWCGDHGEAGLLVDIGRNLGWYWQARGLLDEGRHWLEAMLPNVADDELRWRLGYHGAAIALRQGDYELAQDHAARLLAIARERQDPALLVRSLDVASASAENLGLVERAAEAAAEAVSIARATGDRRGLCLSLMTAGDLALSRGDESDALALHEEALDLAADLGVPDFVATATYNVGLARFCVGDHVGAETAIDAALDLSRQEGDRELVGYCLDLLGALGAATDNPKRAAELQAAAGHLLASVGAHLEVTAQSVHDRVTADLALALSTDDLDHARAAGRALGVEEAIAIAIG